MARRVEMHQNEIKERLTSPEDMQAEHLVYASSRKSSSLTTFCHSVDPLMPGSISPLIWQRGKSIIAVRARSTPQIIITYCPLLRIR